jgi:hypothetical protein
MPHPRSWLLQRRDLLDRSAIGHRQPKTVFSAWQKPSVDFERSAKPSLNPLHRSIDQLRSSVLARPKNCIAPTQGNNLFEAWDRTHINKVRSIAGRPAATLPHVSQVLSGGNHFENENYRNSEAKLLPDAAPSSLLPFQIGKKA